MLVLTRHCGETIVIGKDIRIKVLQAHGQSIRLGIEAPQTFSVHRQEIYERIAQAAEQVAPATASCERTKKVKRTISQPAELDLKEIA